ncbi:hypothetical protein BGZ58_009921 [Dissophora ornata]|nr:hypothetical protein BGZ58_009921 [Dissophora ornata]
MHRSADSNDTTNNHQEVVVESVMKEDEENPSFINTATSEIDAQFQDLMRTSSSRGSKGDSAEEEDDSQDWEWVEETDYFIMDFGGAALDGEDMEKICSSGYSLVGLETPTPYFKAGVHAFKGFYDENAITEDLLFDMKVSQHQEENMEDSDDENNSDALDLIAIVTKRLIFEPVDLLPVIETNPLLDATQEGNNEDMEEENPEEITSTEEPPASTSSRKEPRVSIWRAAFDAVGLERKKRNKVDTEKGKDKGKDKAREASRDKGKGKIKTSVKDMDKSVGWDNAGSQAGPSAPVSAMEVDTPAPTSPGGDDDDTAHNKDME